MNEKTHTHDPEPDPERLRDDDRWIDLLLERDPRAVAAAARELAALRSDPRVAPRLAQLERMLGIAALTARAVEPSPARGDALAKRILAATTREDLSWRGDVRLVVAHVRRRCRESRVTRYVAALLLANVTLGPVAAVAWVLIHDAEPKRELHIRIEPREEPLPEVEPDALEPLEVGEDPHAARAHAEIENLLRRARYLLAPAHGAVPAPAELGSVAVEPAPVALRLLDARARFAQDPSPDPSPNPATWPEWLDEASWETGSDALTLALYAELMLDRYAVRGDRAPRFHAALERLRHALAAAPDGPERRLAEHALDRARAYGVVAGESGTTRLDPLDDQWRADLGLALGELADDPRASAWIRAAR